MYISCLFSFPNCPNKVSQLSSHMHQAVIQRSACSLERHTGQFANQDALLQSLPALTAFRPPAIPQDRVPHNNASIKLSQGSTRSILNHQQLLKKLGSMQ